MGWLASVPKPLLKSGLSTFGREKSHQNLTYFKAALTYVTHTMLRAKPVLL